MKNRYYSLYNYSKDSFITHSAVNCTDQEDYYKELEIQNPSLFLQINKSKEKTYNSSQNLDIVKISNKQYNEINLIEKRINLINWKEFDYYSISTDEVKDYEAALSKNKAFFLSDFEFFTPYLPIPGVPLDSHFEPGDQVLIDIKESTIKNPEWRSSLDLGETAILYNKKLMTIKSITDNYDIELEEDFGENTWYWFHFGAHYKKSKKKE